MIARLSAFVIWTLVAAAIAFWGLRLFARGDPIPANAVVVGEATQARGDFSRLLGAEPVAQAAVAPAASSRFKLLGVMAGKPSAEGMTPGVALISVDGKPARAFSAGSRLDEQLVLQNVSMRSASIGAAQGGNSFTLELPALPPPATGTLPRAAGDSVPPVSPQPASPPVVQRPVPQADQAVSPEPRRPVRTPPTGTVR